jgi:outer membrane translocation and assembly module TamA
VTDRLVWANRVQVGSIGPANDDPTQVPFSKKYFLGGAGSVRGWGRYEISPLAGGYPVGGNSLLAFTSEARATLRGKLGGVLFLDTGNVWENAWTVRLNELRYALGAGLRYQTPVGPIRFDFGYQLNPEPGLLVNGHEETRHWRIHFSIGQAF